MDTKWIIISLMRVFITSTPAELEPCQRAAVEVARELGHEPVLRDPEGRRGLDLVSACRDQVTRADALLAIVGWRRGPVPPVAEGGDGLRPWSYFEVRSAIEVGLPVAAMLAGEALASGQREDTAEARAVMADLRGELGRLASFFDTEAEFRQRIDDELREIERASWSRTSWSRSNDFAGLKPRRFEPPQMPARPYPLLLPYTHPDLMAGREEDLARLGRLLARPVTVVGLYATSGTGKSSLLAGGLVPSLRAAGRPVALTRHPAEAGLATRLLADLVEGGEEIATEDTAGARRFIDQMVRLGRLAGASPLLVIDQFEDLLKDGAAGARAAFGILLAASAQRWPGLDGPPCRWLLAYRQEYHGQLRRWLEDVLREARERGFADIETLPHDLTDASRFASWALRPLGTPAAGAEDATAAAARVFWEAIEKPLRHESFGWTFAPGHAERLANAFAAARIRQPDSPLVPELQVVLAHLLERAGEPVDGATVQIEVPAEVVEMIDRALEAHLRRALDFAFPRAATQDAMTARSRALLVLRELAEARGRQEEELADDALARALGAEGSEVLEKLATARTRLVLRERRGDAWVWVLSHDRLAEVLQRVVDEGLWGDFGVDSELLALRRFVALQKELHGAGDVEQATALPAGHFKKIEAHREVLLWSAEHRNWWRACRARRRSERRRRTTWWTLAALALMAVTFGAWTVADRWARRQALLEEVASGEPEVAMAALDRLTGEDDADPEEILERLRRRDKPFDVFERGLGGVGRERRAEVLVRVAALALPILERAPEDAVLISSLVWPLDVFAGAGYEARDSAVQDEALKLRGVILEPLRRRRPPPPLPATGDPDWADIPAGTFWMGAGADDGRKQPNMQNEFPRHPVELSAFRMLRHEVTNDEYRRLVPDHEGADELPAVYVTWYEAYRYAAWLGGRLPTEAEWEYAARAGCAHTYCGSDGSEATLDEVAWWLGNSPDPRTGDPTVRPVMGLEPNPWGLWDVYGNVWELTASWYGPYPANLEKDPPGPTDTPLVYRILRGGSARNARKRVFPSNRGLVQNEASGLGFGLRVVLPPAGD